MYIDTYYIDKTGDYKMAENEKVLTNPKEGEVNTEKGTADESNKGGVSDVFNEAQKTEMAKLIQSNVDRTAQKLKTEYEAQIKDLRNQLETEKQAKMTEAEKAEYERSQYEKMKADFERDKLSFELSKKVALAEIPIQFADIWLNPPTSAKELDEKIEGVKNFFGSYKSQLLEGYRKDNVRVPEGQKGISNKKAMKREAFDKLQPAEKTAFIQSGGTLE